MTGKNKSGLTLIEVLLTTGMVAVVGLTFAAIYVTAQSFLIQSTIFVSSNSEAAYAVEHMKRKIALANLVNVYPSGGIGFRYDHKIGGAQTPNNVNDDEWDYYALRLPAVGASLGTLIYKRDFVPGAVAGGAVPADPLSVGGEVIAQNILAPNGGSIPVLFQVQSNGGVVEINFTAHRQTTNQLSKDTQVENCRVSPRGVSSI